MKKLLVLVLVLSMAAMAGATSVVIYELRAADGSTPISEVNINVDSGAFTIVVIGTTAVYPWAEGIFDNHDWFAPGGVFDFVVPGGVTILSAAGDLGGVTDYGMDGYMLTAGDMGGGTCNPADGDWFIVDCQALELGTATVDVLDTQTNVIDQFSFDIVPEPMTIALLGLGGLFLRRRK